MPDKKPILIAGLPRSGTTWVSNVLSTSDTTYLHEPDNEKLYLMAFHAKRQLNRFPYLRADDSHTKFARLWTAVFKGDEAVSARLKHPLLRLTDDVIEYDVERKCQRFHDDSTENSLRHTTNLRALSPIERVRLGALSPLVYYEHARKREYKGKLIVKSVHMPLALSWFRKQYEIPTLLVLRHPFDIASSHLRLNMPDADRNVCSQSPLCRDVIDSRSPSTSEPLTSRLAYQLAIMKKVVEQTVSQDKGIIVVHHEALCLDPINRFKDICLKLDLPWSSEIEHKISDLDRKGPDGYSLRRKTREQVGKWKKELSPEILKTLRTTFESVGVSESWTL